MKDECLKPAHLGLCMLYALLDEFSCGEESSQLNVLLESHIFLRARFQVSLFVLFFLELNFITILVINGWLCFFILITKFFLFFFENYCMQ